MNIGKSALANPVALTSNVGICPDGPRCAADARGVGSSSLVSLAYLSRCRWRVSTSRDNIRQNYRNSREILNAAYNILVNNLDDELFEEGGLELLDPKYANFSSGAPLALYADNLEEEIAYARSYAAERLVAGAHSACIAFAGYSARDIEAYATKCGVPSLNGLYDPQESPLVFSDLEQTKGYEFETLIVVNCRAGVIPAIGAPDEEAFRQGCKLYVAMTRARRELILSFNTEASPWLVQVADTIHSDDWANCEELKPEFLAGIPDCLPEVEDETVELDIAGMTGREFLFTDFALGMSIEAQDKLAELVDGRGARTADNRRVRWPYLGDLAGDLARSRRSDNLFGPKAVEEIRVALAAAMPDRVAPSGGRLSLRAS